MSALAILALLTACAPAPGPTPTAAAPSKPTVTSATPTPTPTPDDPAVAAAAIVMNTDGLIVVAADSTVLANIPYSSAVDAAVAQLGEVTGVEATVTVHPGDEHCVPETTRYDLGGLVLSTPSRSPEAQFSVRVEAAGLATGLDLQFTNGMQVGSSLDEVRSAIPGIRTEAWPDGVVVAYFDLRGDLDDYSSNSDPYGGLAVVRDGVVVSFSAPHHHFYDC